MRRSALLLISGVIVAAIAVTSTVRPPIASAQYGGTWSPWIRGSPVVQNQWVTGWALVRTYQTSDPTQRYWQVWADTSTGDYSGEIYTRIEGHDRCSGGSYVYRMGGERIDYNGTYGTSGGPYQGVYGNCFQSHTYRQTSWHYRKWVGGTTWEGGWAYSFS